VQKIAALNIAGRMSLAMKGTREERAVLVRDPNRIVAAAVLSSPKLNEAEIEAIAKMANVSEDVLRTIGTSRAWTKSYSVVHALVRNPEDAAGDVDELPAADQRSRLARPVHEPQYPGGMRLAARKKVVIDK
jgi:hypothetical protein